jgi:hypothetical protein
MLIKIVWVQIWVILIYHTSWLELSESVLDWKFMLLHLFEFTSSCISSIVLSEIPFSNNQMVNTRSGEGQDIPPVFRAHIAN